MSDVANIETLLREAGQAHHEAFLDADGADPEWPIWYAEYLHPRLAPVMGAPVSRSRLVQVLLTLEDARARLAPGAEWPRYYAEGMAALYG